MWWRPAARVWSYVEDEVVACVRTLTRQPAAARRPDVSQRSPRGLEALADWLAAQAVTEVVMEATGQYWKPVWYVLEDGASSSSWSTPAMSRSCPVARPTWPTRPGWPNCSSIGLLRGELRAPAGDP